MNSDAAPTAHSAECRRLRWMFCGTLVAVVCSPETVRWNVIQPITDLAFSCSTGVLGIPFIALALPHTLVLRATGRGCVSVHPRAPCVACHGMPRAHLDGRLIVRAQSTVAPEPSKFDSYDLIDTWITQLPWLLLTAERVSFSAERKVTAYR